MRIEGREGDKWEGGRKNGREGEEEWEGGGGRIRDCWSKLMKRPSSNIL